jgi:hypothetical protein
MHHISAEIDTRDINPQEITYIIDQGTISIWGKERTS